jgi:membrane associated rhomboid family serine protease
MILLAVVGGLAYRISSPDERERYLAIAIKYLQQLKVAATKPGPEHDAFRDALRARTSHALVTMAIVSVSAAIVGGMLFGAGAMSDPGTLVAWGASLGTRTTNGEWWRLATSIFVHTGLLHLLVDVAVLIQLGGILERLVGRLTFAAVYLLAGVFAGLVNLSIHPLAVTVGASAAIFGLYGLLLATVFWQMFHRWRSNPVPDAENPVPDPEEGVAPGIRIPLVAVKRIGAGAAVFFVYSVLTGFAHSAEFIGLLVGLMYGMVFARGCGEDGAAEGPQTRHVAVAMVATAAIVVMCAITLRGIADVKPEIARVLATEERTAAEYRTWFDAFKKGRITGDALAQLAEGTILPELQAVDARLKALSNIPPEHRAVVADAREYLRLRYASWRARAEAIRKTSTAPSRAPDGPRDGSWRLQAEARFRSNMAVMGSVEGQERASLEAFQRVKLP